MRTHLLSRGGVDATSRKYREASSEGADGVVLAKNFLDHTTPSARAKVASHLFLTAHPPSSAGNILDESTGERSPLLARRGGRDIKKNVAKLPLMERTGWWFKIERVF